MDRRGTREGRNILLVVGFIGGWGASHFQFSTREEEIVFLILAILVVFLASAVLGRRVLRHDDPVPWSHVLAGTGLFVGAGLLSYLIFGPSSMRVKEWLALLIALSVLAVLAYKNLWVTRRSDDRASSGASRRRE
jgi:peptidoglycan/LPS O-acetylase OafA/YrhL